MGTQPAKKWGMVAFTFRPMSVVAKRLDGSRFKVPLCTEVSLGPGRIVLEGTRLPPKMGGHSPSSQPVNIVAKRWDGSGCHLVWRYSLAQATLCYMGTQPPKMGHGSLHFSADVFCGQTAGWIKIQDACRPVDGDPSAPLQKWHSPRI